MNRDELAVETSKRTGYTRSVCREIVREMWQVMFDEMGAHGELTIPRVGKFLTKTNKSRRTVLPNGETIMTTPSYTVKFVTSDTLKEEMNK